VETIHMSHFNYSKKRMRADYTVIRSLGQIHDARSSYRPVIAILRGRKFKEASGIDRLCDKTELFKLTQVLANEGLGQLISIPKGLQNIALLEAIDMDNNAISEVPSWLDNLSFLRNISFQNNRLFGWPAAFNKLNFLEGLYLSNNEIGTIPNAAFSHMMNLEKLSLHCCDLNEFNVQFQDYCQLNYLDLSWNDIKCIDTDLSKCVRLEHLDLNNMKLTSFPKDIFGLLNLTYLSISGTLMSHVPDEVIQLTNLRVLDLSDCGLFSIPLKLLQLPNLEELYLGGNYFSKEHNEQIVQCAPKKLKLDYGSMFGDFVDLDDEWWD